MSSTTFVGRLQTACRPPAGRLQTACRPPADRLQTAALILGGRALSLIDLGTGGAVSAAAGMSPFLLGLATNKDDRNIAHEKQNSSFMVGDSPTADSSPSKETITGP